MQTKIFERYFFFTLLFLSMLFVIILFRPFLAVIAISASLAVVLYPIYAWLQKKKFPDWISAFFVVLFFIIVLCGPLLGIGALVFDQTQEVYQQVVIDQGTSGIFINSVGDGINKFLPDGMHINASEKMADLVSFITGNIAKVFTTTLSTIFSFLLTLLALFYFLKDGAHWKKALIILSPLSDKDDEKILNRLSLAINGVVKGYLFIGIVQGTLMGLGLAIFGVPNPALWGVVAAIASMIPTVGTALVSVPAIIFLFAVGKSANAIGMIIWATALVGTIDNFLSPFIVGNKVNVPPLLILFSVLGGISLLGPVGLLIGPLAVSLLYTLVSIYRNEFKQGINL